MDDPQSRQIQCPYCGEKIAVDVDCSVRRQFYIEDCAVCCRPITIPLIASDGEVENVEARSEDE